MHIYFDDPQFKSKPNSFENTELAEYLKSKGITNLIICGMQTNVCVQKTSIFAKENKYEVTVISDACAAVSQEKFDEGMKAINDAGVSVVQTKNISKMLIKK